MYKKVDGPQISYLNCWLEEFEQTRHYGPNEPSILNGSSAIGRIVLQSHKSRILSLWSWLVPDGMLLNGFPLSYYICSDGRFLQWLKTKKFKLIQMFIWWWQHVYKISKWFCLWIPHLMVSNRNINVLATFRLMVPFGLVASHNSSIWSSSSPISLLLAYPTGWTFRYLIKHNVSSDIC